MSDLRTKASMWFSIPEGSCHVGWNEESGGEEGGGDAAFAVSAGVLGLGVSAMVSVSASDQLVGGTVRSVLLLTKQCQGARR